MCALYAERKEEKERTKEKEEKKQKKVPCTLSQYTFPYTAHTKTDPIIDSECPNLIKTTSLKFKYFPFY